MTLRLFEAVIIVGETVGESSGSIIAAAAGSTPAQPRAPGRVGGTEPQTASRNAATSGISCRLGLERRMRSISPAALTSALSAIEGSDAWPLRPWTRRTKGELIFSAVAQR